MFDILSLISVEFTKNELKEILKKFSEGDEIVIRSIETRSDEETKGDSYLSTIYRFSVDAYFGKENINIHVIAKGFPKNIARRKTFRSVDFFETEIYFYNKVWPMMKRLKISQNINEPDEVPLLLSSYCDGKNDYIALKDISFDGYRTVKRGLGINREYASLFLKLLANFHALSIVAKHQTPEFEEIASSLKETYFDERLRSWYTGFMYNKLYKVVRHAVETQLGHNGYLQKVDDLFSKDFFGRLCKLTKYYSGKLLAVVQGDAWIPNFLVKVRDGKPQHAVLIDFQLARYSSVTGDLLQFIFSCVSPEILLEHWDDLIEEYHKYLSERIALLGCDPSLITLEDLKGDIKENPHVGFAMAMESTVMSLLEDDEVPELDTIKGNEAVPLETIWDISPFQDVSKNKRVAFLIKFAVDKGFI